MGEGWWKSGRGSRVRLDRLSVRPASWRTGQSAGERRGPERGTRGGRGFAPGSRVGGGSPRSEVHASAKGVDLGVSKGLRHKSSAGC